MKSRRVKCLLGVLALVFLCAQLSEGLSITRDRSEDNVDEEVAQIKSKLQKKHQTQKKLLKPIIDEKGEKKVVKKKLKISELRPCISKAFCEVNSITDEPTYETTREFFEILDRLKKFREEQEEVQVAAKEGSREDSASSEESFEDERNRPYPPPGPPTETPFSSMFSFFRRSRSMQNETAPSAATNATVKAEQRAYISRKKQELNVVNDLAALIKISAEIGQALRSPRKCRSLFRKCQMSYDQIIKVFNKTQAVEKEGDGEHAESQLFSQQEPFSTFQDFSSLPSTEKPEEMQTSTVKPPTEEKSPASALPEEMDLDLSGEVNRNKKSRTGFDSEEEPDYSGSSEAAETAQKTYSLFTQGSEQGQRPGHYQQRDDLEKDGEEAVDEASFQKYDSAFPSTKKEKTKVKEASSKSKSRPTPKRPASSEEEGETSNESYSHERPQRDRASIEENENSDEMEVEMEVPEKKKKEKPTLETVPLVHEADDEENDSDQEIPSNEIGQQKQKPQQDEKVKGKGGEESSEEEEEDRSAEDQEDHDLEAPPKDETYNTFGFYPNFETPKKPASSYKVSNSKKNKDKTSKKNKKKKKGEKEKPQEDKDQGSSEEEGEMPPPGSAFYEALKLVNGGKGAQVVPGKNPYDGEKGGKKKKKNKKHKEEEDEPEAIGPIKEQINYVPNNYPPAPPPSFFQSIMGWFSRGKSDGFYNPNQPQPYSPNYPEQYPYQQQQQGMRPQPSPSSGEAEEYEVVKPSKGKGRRGDSSEEEEEDDQGDDDEDEEEDEEPRRKETSGNGRERPAHVRSPAPPQHGYKRPVGVSTGLSLTGPPPPLVIVPQGETADPPLPPPAREPQQQPSQRRKPTKKEKEEEEEKRKREDQDASEENTSSEEDKKSSGKRRQPIGGPGLSTIYSDVFPSAAAIDQQFAKEKEQASAENTKLLLSTFSTISNTFSTSADKVPDWEREDNPDKRINVANLLKPSGGKYTVKKNKRKTLSQQDVGSYEEENKRNSSEEEEEDKKR